MSFTFLWIIIFKRYKYLFASWFLWWIPCLAIHCSNKLLFFLLKKQNSASLPQMASKTSRFATQRLWFSEVYFNTAPLLSPFLTRESLLCLSFQSSRPPKPPWAYLCSGETKLSKLNDNNASIQLVLCTWLGSTSMYLTNLGSKILQKNVMFLLMCIM